MTERKLIKIGEIEFPFKKSALEYYKKILNSYDFGEELNSHDTVDVLNLLELHPRIKEKTGVGIEKVRIGKAKFNTKSFELVRFDGSTTLFSYTKRINSPKSDFTKFTEACREAIQGDLIQVKQRYFDEFSVKGRVKCQETGEPLKWDELNIDHRQPNTFSVIVDRFIELNNLDLKNIKYIPISGGHNEIADENLKADFIQYHKEKANLRIISKRLNMGRSYQARIKRQNKDLRIE